MADLLHEIEQRQRIRRKPKAQQRKARRDAQRNRATYDLLPELEAAVSEVAKHEGLSKSATVSLLLAEGVRQYVEGDVSFHRHKTPANHPLYDWLVDPETVMAVLKRERSLRG